MKTMYEVNWYGNNDIFTKCTVTPIYVEREGVLPGCTGVSITATDAEGRKFQGSPRNYFNTEEEAWASVRDELRKSLDSLEIQKKELEDDIDAQFRFLLTLKAPE
jgi:hypothetical protein